MAARTSRVRAAGALVLVPMLLGAVACGGGPGAAAADTADGAATDSVGADAVPGDAPGADVVDADGASADTSAPPPAHCPIVAPEGGPGGPPFSVEAGDDGLLRVVVACDGDTVRVTPLADGVIRVERFGRSKASLRRTSTAARSS